MVVVVGWFLLLSTAHDELEAERDKEPALKADYRTKLAQAVNLGELRKQKLQVEEYVTQLEKQLPGKAEMDALLSDINQAGLGRGLQFELFRPGQVVGQGLLRRAADRDQGAGRYHDIGSFAADIANLSRIVTLHNMNIAARARTPTALLAMEATARTYRYLDAAEIEEVRRARPRKAKAGSARNERRRRRRSAGTLGGTASSLRRPSLAACAADEDELQPVDGAAEARGQAERRAAVRAEEVQSAAYVALGAVEPFSTQKLTVALKQEARQPNSLLAAEINRRKEPLEAYPLDSMAMVGSVTASGGRTRC